MEGEGFTLQPHLEISLMHLLHTTPSTTSIDASCKILYPPTYHRHLAEVSALPIRDLTAYIYLGHVVSIPSLYHGVRRHSLVILQKTHKPCTNSHSSFKDFCPCSILILSLFLRVSTMERVMWVASTRPPLHYSQRRKKVVSVRIQTYQSFE